MKAVLEWLFDIIVGVFNWFTRPPKGFHRRLGLVEKFYADCNELGLFTTGMVVFVSSDVPLTREHLLSATKRLMMRHPLLRMRITHHRGQRYWQEMDDVRPDVRVQETNDWNTVYEDTVLEKYRIDTGPLWRVTLLPDVTSDFSDNDFKHHAALVLGFLHSITDGQGEFLHNPYIAILDLMTSLRFIMTSMRVVITPLRDVMTSSRVVFRSHEAAERTTRPASRSIERGLQYKLQR